MTIDTQKLRDGPYLRDGKETMRIMNEAADALDAQAAEIARLREALTDSVRELHACQAVIHLAGGFDPAYVNGAQAALKKARAAVAQEGS